MRTLLAAFLLLGALTAGHAAADYERDVANLAPGKPAAETKASFEALKTAGSAAFPTLIAHFADRDLAAQCFHEASKNDPTIGGTCFEIVQSQIEGDWPISFRSHHLLSPGNTAQWLEAHKGLTVAQLHRAAIAETLRHAEASFQQKPSDPSLKQLVSFLRLELDQSSR